MAKNDTRKLICAACQHQNEVERVYCHNCGEKLDRSLLPQIDPAELDSDKAKAGKKVQKLMNANRFNWLRNLKTFVLIELFAAVIAAGFLAVQPPENVPPMKAEGFPDKDVGDVWAGMMKAPPAVSVTFRETDVNFYLRKAVKGGEGPLGTNFERAFAHFEPGLAAVTTQRNLWGLPIYSSATFKPARTGGKWSADIQSLSIGRLAIPKQLATLTKLDTVVLGALSPVFEKEIKQSERLEKIEPGAGMITLVTKPAQ